ncbi:hypothetical protein [Actinomadura xylanilytica]|uniref:hypothetical protein n=1 Tax=Actinomadura xylanilytica TaxID=887459 RepID=UPI00255B208A|nr:hypothetical protein [Actinomadura xylanilytica]MDL4772972.1 hypothetical protein [Actinomadura xylanilytica]
MRPRRAPAESGKRRRRRVPPLRRESPWLVALLALGAALVIFGLLPASAPEALGQVPGISDPSERSQSAGGTLTDPVQLSIGALPAAQAPGQVATVALVALPEPHWGAAEWIRTIDADPGGYLKWDRASGRIQICDKEEDDHLVRGRVFLDGSPLTLRILRTKKMNKLLSVADSGGHCREAAIPNYKVPKKGKPLYKFQVCLSRSDKDLDAYCNTSDSKEWPVVERKTGDCWKDGMSDKEKITCVGGVYEYCHQWQHISGMFPPQCEKDATKLMKETKLRPAVGRPPDINARPDLALPRGHPADIGKATRPVAIMLRWLVWTVLGGCVAGFVVVGGRMTIKHKRGEAGANFTELGWVMIASVSAASGVAIAFVSLLVDPF